MLIVTIKNTAGTISMSAVPWVDGIDTAQMDSDTTRVATVSGGYDSKVSLNENSQNFGIIPEQGVMDLFLQLRANLIDPLFSGELSQEMDVNLIC